MNRLSMSSSVISAKKGRIGGSSKLAIPLPFRPALPRLRDSPLASDLNEPDGQTLVEYDDEGRWANYADVDAFAFAFVYLPGIHPPRQ